jgi:VWFA-related protein
MKNGSLLPLLLTLVSFTPVLGQGQTPSPTPQKQGTLPDEVLRITTNLVQLDVLVTDKDGNHVTDLHPEDFEVVEDKDKQQINSFSYITLGPPVTISQPTAPNAGPSKPGTTPIVPAPLRLDQVHRTIALVVDDLGLSFESIISVRDALKKFVNEQMQPNDLVAILRTSRGIGSLQQFTSDKGQLLAAIDSVSWYGSGRGGLSPNPQIDTQIGQDSTQGAQLVNEMEEARAATYSVGTIQTLSRILQGLRDLPGRKALMLYSESFMLFTSQGRNTQLLDALQKLTDRANQSSAVIYTIDASGLNPLDLTASDRVSGQSYTFNPETFGSVMQPRNRVATRRIDAPQSASAQAEADSAAAFRRLEGLMQQKENSQYQSQTVLSLLAEQTGGTFTKNTNDLSLGTQRMLENESGYYLIGYRPEDITIDPATGRRRLHDIKVKVKRPGLRVRSRAGFYGVNLEAAATSRPRTRDQQLSAALTSPFAAGGIGLRITPIFGNDPAAGSYLRVLLHINSQNLTFSAQPNGSRRAVMDVVAVNFGSEGKVVDQFSDTQTIDVRDDAYLQMLKDGLVFILNVPTKKPGPMQLRVGVRDAASERIGSASQFVQAPDLSKNRLALSGLYVSGSNQEPANSASAGREEKKASGVDAMAGPAVRRLRQGMILNYAYTIYNAQLDNAGHPQLQTQMRLFREGKEVFTGKLSPFNVLQQTDLKRLDAGGGLLVGSNLSPGEYVLQVTVTDVLAKNKGQSTATQWIDFEIVR